jgi:hypothetical protein
MGKPQGGSHPLRESDPRAQYKHAFQGDPDTVIDRIWELAAKHSPSAVQGFLQSHELQHAATEDMDHTLREHIQLGTNDFRRTMLTAAAASNASAFLFAHQSSRIH